MRWADTDSEDSDDEFQTHPSRSGNVINTAMIDLSRDAPTEPTKFEDDDDGHSVASFSSSESEASLSTPKETPSERAARLESLRIAKEEEEKKRKAELHKQRSMTKQEKKAVGKKALDDLDDLLGEFGIDAAEDNGGGGEKEEEKKGDDNDAVAVAVAEESTSTTNAASKKKKKKKGKKKATGGGESNAEDGNAKESTDAGAVDIAAVVKSKAKSTKKSAAEIAAATAAKDAKVKAEKKKEAEKKKKKKKNKDKYPRQQR